MHTSLYAVQFTYYLEAWWSSVYVAHKYSHFPSFVVFLCGLEPVDFTNIIQEYLTDAESVTGLL